MTWKRFRRGWACSLCVFMKGGKYDTHGPGQDLLSLVILTKGRQSFQLFILRSGFLPWRGRSFEASVYGKYLFLSKLRIKSSIIDFSYSQLGNHCWKCVSNLLFFFISTQRLGKCDRT